jgi:hypothetical protein
MSDQRPTAGVWGLCGLVIVGVLVFYPISLGPSCWLSSRFGGGTVVSAVYRPLTWTAIATNSPALRSGIDWYSTVGAADYWIWMKFGHNQFGGPDVVEWEWTGSWPRYAEE